jgi:hypothetical protein
VHAGLECFVQIKTATKDRYIQKKKDGDETDREMDREHGVMSLLAGTSQRTGAFCPASSQIMHGHIPHMESIDPFA